MGETSDEGWNHGVCLPGWRRMNWSGNVVSLGIHSSIQAKKRERQRLRIENCAANCYTRQKNGRRRAITALLLSIFYDNVFKLSTMTRTRGIKKRCRQLAPQRGTLAGLRSIYRGLSVTVDLNKPPNPGPSCRPTCPRAADILAGCYHQQISMRQEAIPHPDIVHERHINLTGFDQ